MSTITQYKAIQKSCCGYAKAGGGLNLGELRELSFPVFGTKVYKLKRNELLALICKEIHYDCNPEFRAELVRDYDDIVNTIKRTAKYADMRNDIEEIMDHWKYQSNCQLCGYILDIETLLENRQAFKMKSRSNAIDHKHNLQGTGLNSYRGRLCDVCNTQEGHAREESNEDFHEHVKLLAKKRGIDPIIVYAYLYDTYYGLSPMDLSDPF